MRASVTGLGVLCGLGQTTGEVEARLGRGESALVDLEVEGSRVRQGSRVKGPDLRPWLSRRKDRKLFSRCAELLLGAAGSALGEWPGDRETLGLFVGVRREPSDAEDADAALLACAEGGELSLSRLCSQGRDLYPPLHPLKTLPNMALAHVAIQLGIRGTSGTTAGGPAAGVMAVREGIAAVAEGRCRAALAGAVDSWLDPGSLRDWARLGRTACSPGEAAVVLRLEPAGHPAALFELERGEAGVGASPSLREHWPALGHCGVADALVALVAGAPTLRGVDDTGVWGEAMPLGQ